MTRQPWVFTTQGIRFLCGVGLVFLLSMGVPANAQENPFELDDILSDDAAMDDAGFDDQNPAFGDGAGFEDDAELDDTGTSVDAPLGELTEEPTEEETPVVRSELVATALRSIEANDPQSPTELMRAVHILHRLGAASDAQVYLDRILNQLPKPDQLITVHKEIGTGALVQIANNKELGPDALTLVRAIFQAVRESKRDPERLARLIEQLAEKDPELRRQAIVGISEAGSHAIPALLDAYREPPEGVSVAILDATTKHVGARAEDPLIAAMGSSESAIQEVAARLLGIVGTKQARVHLIRPCFSTEPAIRDAARRSLTALDLGLPTERATATKLVEHHARQHLLGRTPSPVGVTGRLLMWTWSAEEQNVRSHELAGSEAQAVIAARLARDAFELNPSPANQRMLLVSRLQVDQLLGGLDEGLPRGAGTAYELATTAGATASSDALSYALQHGLDAAAQGATEVLGSLGDLALVVASGRRTPLVNALRSPGRRVRYSATRAIMSIDPRRSYPGASHLLETLVELAQARGRSRVLMGTPRQASAEHLDGILTSLGLSTEHHATTRELLLEVTASSDVDVLFLSDSMNRLSVSELVQHIRRSPRSAQLPIVLLVRDGQLRRAQRIASQNDRVTVMPEYADEDEVIRTLTAVEASVRDTAVAPQQRLSHAMDALSWLSHIAEYSQSYRWYDIMRARNVAKEAVTVDPLASQAIDLLGYLGDQSAQQLLLRNASLSGLSAERRQRAANAFAESVVRRGLMVKSSDVNRHYEHQKSSTSQDESAQEILSQVREVIESQTKASTAK